RATEGDHDDGPGDAARRQKSDPGQCHGTGWHCPTGAAHCDVPQTGRPGSAGAPGRGCTEPMAVVIGVGDYENKNIAKLRYTVNDAEVLYRTITGPGGFKKEHVLLLTDKTERKPTLRNIKWALGTFLARSAKRDDTVLIFFAGHGAPEIDQRGLER